jgi:hypothetical protein
MKQPATAGTPHLVVLTPGPDQGRRIDLTGDHLVVGRSGTCDVRFEDLAVSRTHAALWRQGGSVHVQDLDSSGGTFVNRAALTAARELHSGDLVSFATVELRYSGGQAVEPPTRVGRVPGPTPPVSYDIGQQQGESISNVGGDQYNSYVQHVRRERDGFLREIAATRTKARWLVWTGVLLFVVGFGLFAAADIGFLQQVGDGLSGDPAAPTDPFGQEVAGVPSGLLGWALAALGSFLVLVGVVLHVVATSRRKRVDRDYSVPPPWRAPDR